MKRAAAYVRMSSEAQAASPAQQREAIEQLAKQQKYRIIEWFEDPGVPGDDTRKRPKFRELMERAAKGEFAVVLAWDGSRLGRFDSLTAGRWYAPLRDVGCAIHTCTEGLQSWESMADRIVHAVAAEQRSEFLRSLSKNVSRGRAAAARRGRIAGTCPFGYAKQFRDPTGAVVATVEFRQKFRRPKEWVESLVPSSEPGAVEVIQQIFADVIAGKPLRAIVRELNARGVVPHRGGASWSAEGVRCILRNPAYIGRWVFGRNPKGRYSRIEEPIVEHAAWEPLVSVVDFERVQAIMADRRNRKLRPRETNYPLSGILTCSECGSRMWGSYYRRRQYRCVECGRRVDCDLIDGAIIARLQSQVHEEIARMESLVHTESKSKPSTSTRSMRRELHQLQTKIEKARVNILSLDPDDVGPARETLRQWKAQAVELERRIAEADVGPPDVSEALANLRNLDETLAACEPLEIRELFSSFIKTAVAVFHRPKGGRFRCVAVEITRIDGSEMRLKLG